MVVSISSWAAFALLASSVSGELSAFAGRTAIGMLSKVGTCFMGTLVGEGWSTGEAMCAVTVTAQLEIEQSSLDAPQRPLAVSHVISNCQEWFSWLMPLAV